MCLYTDTRWTATGFFQFPRLQSTVSEKTLTNIFSIDFVTYSSSEITVLLFTRYMTVIKQTGTDLLACCFNHGIKLVFIYM